MDVLTSQSSEETMIHKDGMNVLSKFFVISLTIPHADGINKEPPDSFFLGSNACSLSAEKTIVHLIRS
nr:uncharacterized protein LOC109170148 isoform X2 [Ipomoea trifida]